MSMVQIYLVPLLLIASLLPVFTVHTSHSPHADQAHIRHGGHVIFHNRNGAHSKSRKSRQAGESPCARSCLVDVVNHADIRRTFLDYLEDPDVSWVHFNVKFEGHNESVFERYPHMLNTYQPHTWLWASERVGRKLLGLPYDADVLSLYILSPKRKTLELLLSYQTGICLLTTGKECRLHLMRSLIIKNITNTQRHRHRRNFVCHHVINKTQSGDAVTLHYQCCDTSEFTSGRYSCEQYYSPSQDFSGISGIIFIISAIVTLFSPVLVLRLKLALKFENLTKFFRASLKHGITGQRNYVIRIPSRQLVNLSDPKPFSLPRVVYRLIFHCYGEGRCFIHCWAPWHAQPRICKKTSRCRKCWILFWRLFAVIIVYPSACYTAALLYWPKTAEFRHLLNFTESHLGAALQIDLNLAGTAFLPSYSISYSIWMLFSFISFIYVMLILSWPNSPLERCLLNGSSSRHAENTKLLYARVTLSYKAMLHKLTYGDFVNKRHFFRVPWAPWGLRRVVFFVLRGMMQIPIINVCFQLTAFDNKLFQLRPADDVTIDEGRDRYECPKPPCSAICKSLVTLHIWIGFVLILAGYSSVVFVMTQFIINVMFFTLLGCVLHSTSVLPWLILAIIVLYYLDDTLATINKEHREILKLIDDNSPRITAAEDSEEVFRTEGPVQILKTHNLGAVKFIDGDNTEYVSKELYYNVCTDLKCGWSNSLRRLGRRTAMIGLFLTFVFVVFSTLGAFLGSGILVTIAATLLSFVPKFLEVRGLLGRNLDEKRAFWARIIPDVLDRHIRVDRTRCLDVREEELTTYDVRPIGVLEMEIPRMIQQRSLRLWKFPWVVSADQQTQNHENFILALANKLSAANFLSKVVLRAPSPHLEDETVLRQWCILVENCILEGSATASSINGIPIDAVRLFPEEAQHLVAPFDPGNTIDNVVDTINNELYGPFTKGVLVTIGNTTFAMGKLNDTIFAFNSNCHGEQVTDFFGAVLLTTAFNTQNLQTSIKYLMDPYSPDAVPVYSIVPTEGYVMRSGEAIEIAVPVIEM